jgi:methionyl-tRNA synthetase
VWFDALINYISGLGYPDDPDFKERWSSVEHVVAKDILKPHGVFWPTMLRAAGFPLFQRLYVHGYWNVDERKVSKSLGNMISPLLMRDRYGFDAFRYFLLRGMTFGLDANFTEQDLVGRINADLANNLGNLVSRTLNMTARFCGGQVPEPGATGELETSVEATAFGAADAVDGFVRRLEFHRALEAIFAVVDSTNRYLDARAPWQAAKDPEREEEVRTTLYTCCQALRSVALLLAPFIPDAARAILERLGLPDAIERARLPEDARSWNAPLPGTPTTKGPPLFPRVDPPEVEAG